MTNFLPPFLVISFSKTILGIPYLFQCFHQIEWQILFLISNLYTLVLLKMFTCGQYNLADYELTESLWSVIQTIPSVELRRGNWTKKEYRKLPSNFENIKNRLKFIDDQFNLCKFGLVLLKLTWLVVLYTLLLILILKVFQFFMFYFRRLHVRLKMSKKLLPKVPKEPKVENYLSTVFGEDFACFLR